MDESFLTEHEYSKMKTIAEQYIKLIITAETKKNREDIRHAI